MPSPPAQATASLPDSLYFPPAFGQPTLPAGIQPLTPPCQYPPAVVTTAVRHNGRDLGQWDTKDGRRSTLEEHLRVQLRCWHGFTQHLLGERSCAVLRLFLVLTHPVKECLSFLFLQECACHYLCKMGQRLLHPCSGSPPWSDMVMHSTLALLLILYGFDLTVPVPLGWVGLSRGAARVP